ncbi:GTP cyclohydrolase II [Paraneptunicella aestuarii]|uniref:GTP cyclohydrolase II n=1 Tax=Paraneptunicella aestuarii TaxID=2831148 RepID=UPI001E28BE84|nr:GTP cyclohydrolase II [Paraneptunicella aestuarii]UAA40601.1 GTP cyclohydrolase II [Paraneptunicella aestuarii]
MSEGFTVTVRTRVNIPVINGKYFADLISFNGLRDSKEHLVLGFGDWESHEVPNIRIHSECLTGDVFGSMKCDCGAQLHEAIENFGNDHGILLYMRHEGRGIGLYNKLEAYVLQQKGFDTFQANQMLHFPDDMRDYEPAAGMLKALGITNVRLLSNNPDKASQLEKYGINVIEKQSTGVYCNEHNQKYLRSKAEYSKHDIQFDPSI